MFVQLWSAAAFRRVGVSIIVLSAVKMKIAFDFRMQISKGTQAMAICSCRTSKCWRKIFCLNHSGYPESLLGVIKVPRVLSTAVSERKRTSSNFNHQLDLKVKFSCQEVTRLWDFWHLGSSSGRAFLWIGLDLPHTSVELNTDFILCSNNRWQERDASSHCHAGGNA